MTVIANGPYRFPAVDRQDAFHGAMLLYAGWDRHMMFASPYAWALPPGMSFSAFVEGPLAQAFSMHPDWERIDWAAVTWTCGGEPFVPDFAGSLCVNGLVHKDALRFDTPGLDGIDGLGL